MVDLAKIADLALLLVDGSYGLQMETFEFLNLLQLHGFPKVAGVLTNLDCPRFQKNRTALQTVRKSVKQRLWTESHKGNKMFEFCGGLTGGKYKKNEGNKEMNRKITKVLYNRKTDEHRANVKWLRTKG